MSQIIFVEVAVINPGKRAEPQESCMLLSLPAGSWKHTSGLQGEQDPVTQSTSGELHMAAGQ